MLPSNDMSGRRIGLAATAVLAVVLAACTSSPAASTPSSSFKLQSEYVKLVQDVGPSVVLVETSVGLGSGIIYDAQGDIVTNNHVVTGSQNFLVITSTGKQYPATLVGSFAPDDLAVIRIKATGMHPATFANSSSSRPAISSWRSGIRSVCSRASAKASSARCARRSPRAAV